MTTAEVKVMERDQVQKGAAYMSFRVCLLTAKGFRAYETRAEANSI